MSIEKLYHQDMEIEFNALNDLKYITKELRKDSYTIKNRLQSIIYDNKYINAIQNRLELTYPLIPNERCGLWYLPPQEYTHTCYFKSTDGHTNEWKFSLRRLNLHLIPVIQENGGVTIIDSTRKGKLIPDALLKTIPIWCGVINTICFGESYLKLPKFIPKSEYHEIQKKIPQFIAEITRLQLFSKESLNLRKPLMPYFIYPGNSKLEIDETYFPIVCLSASDSRINNNTGNGDLEIAVEDHVLKWYYIQGSADDHELWVTKDICQGKLTPELFWKFYPELTENDFIVLSEHELVQQLNSLYEKSKMNGDDTSVTSYNIGTTGISFGQIQSDTTYNFTEPIDHLVILSKFNISNIPKHVKLHQHNLESNKKGSKMLREIMPKLIPCLNGTVVVLCDTGKDLSVGVVLAILCEKFQLDFSHRPEMSPKPDKDLVKQFLNKLNAIHQVNPSRNTLQSVNSYIM